MIKESVEDFLKRGGKIKKVDFSNAYEPVNHYRGKFIDYTPRLKKKLCELKTRRENKTLN
jgi:hypothetical protein